VSKQFKRIYELNITTPDGLSRTITELRINFEIKKSVLSYPNQARITLYNLAPDSLAALQTKFSKLVLNAGYEGNLKLIFTGDIRNVYQEKRGVDRLTTVYAGDGQQAWQNSNFNKTYVETMTVQTVVNELISSFSEIGKGVIEGVPAIASNLLGQTLSGSSKDLLDSLADEHGFNWSISDGEINIAPVETPLTSSEAVLISSATGMIGSPTVTEVGADVTTLLNPSLSPESAITIKSIGSDLALGNLYFRDVKRTNAEGTYKIQEVIFKGDSREGEWTSAVKGRLFLNV
jgi:hypothetical protein